MTSVENSSWIRYNPIKKSEIEQILTNGLVWSVIPAGLEEGWFTVSVFALGAFEQFVENRIHLAHPTARRFIPLATTTGVIGVSLLAISGADPIFYGEVAALTSLSSLTFAFIKSATNKPYPSIMPMARKMLSYLPIAGSYFREKPKLL